MSSEQIYYTYYSPTDWQHLNKVKYTENLSNAGDLLVTSSSGFENLNARDVIARDELTSSWGAGIQKQNDFNYNVSVTNGFKFNSSMVNNIQVVSASSNIANTIAKQITIDDFDYDTIFGLTKVNPNVIDYNWYKSTKTDNIFNLGSTITDIEQTRIGPKLFVYGGTSEQPNNYNTGNIAITLNSNTTTVDTFKTNTGTNSYNYTSNYIDKIIRCGGTSCKISLTTPLIKAEAAWPYKIQYNPNQWYHILTNGQKSALLTLPYYYKDENNEIANNQERFYVLNVNKDKNDNPIYSYYKLDKIVENNYYYIVSYFDTRPTIRDNKKMFNSNSTTLFNENTIQIMPLTKFDYQTYIALHNDSTSSCIASCMPVSYTTSKKPEIPLFRERTWTDGPDGGYYPENFGMNPIAIKYEKNITITTTLNYTIANMTNLSNILTGWNYLPKDFTNDAKHHDIARGNLPYINAGIIIYIPSSTIHETSIDDNNKPVFDSNNKFIRFYKWMKSFNTQTQDNKECFWYGVNAGHNSNTYWVDPENINFPTYFKNIYNYINDDNNDLTSVPLMVSTNTDKFYQLSTPAFINFNSGSKAYNRFVDHLPSNGVYLSTTDSNTNFLELPEPITINAGTENEKKGFPPTDTIKFVNTLCVPINNALNTTHTANDNYTFRLSKVKFVDGSTNGNYFYIIGTYIYITRNISSELFSSCPHYLGFSPSTNITTHNLLSKDAIKNNTSDEALSNNTFLYPNRAVKTFMCDSQNYLNTFNGIQYVNNEDASTKSRDYYALMKDMFVTPSLYMTINESVGDV